MYNFNNCQSSIEDLELNKYSKEVQEQFYDCLNSIPYIKELVSSERLRAKDLPKDDKGRIIVDITKPHILEDMDYFRPAALYYKQNKCYIKLRPNPNPNSEFGKWIREESRRCFEGYVRPSDGEWITGDMYFFLNYCPIQVSRKTSKTGKKAQRIIDFPDVWEGHYYKFHYLQQARENGKHSLELSRRGSGKSFTGASLLAKRFILGESEDVNRRVQCVVTAAEKKHLTGANKILDMFVYYIDYLAQTMQWPSARLSNSLQLMQWTMGYIDSATNTRKGTENAVTGISSKDDESKLRGSRGMLYILEEIGSFPRLLSLYNVLRPSVEDGDNVFGLIHLQGTAGDSESDFSSAQELMYNPQGYNLYAIKNVYDKEGQGKRYFTFFFPGYLNRANCYDSSGNSDVTKALLQILANREVVKYGTTDINSVTKCISEIPITPQEAVIRTRGNIFPINDLNSRINQLDNDPSSYDDDYIGTLIFDKDHEVEFMPTGDIPIRNFPLKDNKCKGAIEIFMMPEKDRNGKVYPNRYIVGHDPVDDDYSNTLSLVSTFVLDLWTDSIVAEYTGRQDTADENFEIVRRLCLFYNGKCLYEAHPYDQIVRLPNGTTKLWGDIKVGDTLFGINNTTVKVINIPMDGVDDIYKVTLLDGRVVEASSGHKWVVNKINNFQKSTEITTKEMFDFGVKNKYGQHNFCIPESGGVEYLHKDTIIDAYTLGLLIAEGAFTKFRKNKVETFNRRMLQFSSSLEDAEFYKSVLPYPIKYIGNKGYSWHIYIDNIDKKLQELGLLFCDSSSKFIPKSYLFNDYNTRLELLKGLMDGDGCALTKGGSIYITTSKQLAQDIMLLCRSLGFKVSEQNTSTNKDYKQSYRLCIAATKSIFKLPRKVKKQHVYTPYIRGSKSSAILYKTPIASIEYVGRKQCKCVTVDNSNGLYLIGDYVVTHNCNKKGLFAYFSRMSSSYLLADTPEYLRDKSLIKEQLLGNKSKGVNASKPINDYANSRIKEWLIKPVTSIIKKDGTDVETNILNLYRIKSRALLKELALFNPEINVDRVRALGMVMLYREEFMINYQGDPASAKERMEKDYLGDDPFFKNNYDARHTKKKFSILDQ